MSILNEEYGQGLRQANDEGACLPQIISVASAERNELDLILAGRLPGYRVDRTIDRIQWIRDAARFHITNNPIYARLAAAQQFDPESIQDSQDLMRIPLIPTSLFKRCNLVSKLEGRVQHCASSGTSGEISKVPRDQPTLERFMHGLLLGAREFYPYRENRRAYILAPKPEEAGTLWFSFVTSLLDVAFDADFFVENDRLQFDKVVASLVQRPRGEQPIIVSPPSLLFDLCTTIAERNILIDLEGSNPQIITGGGWKRRSNERIDREALAAMVQATLGVPPVNIRDMFNMVELNTLIYECEHRRKHAPPWLDVSVRSPYDNSVCSSGETGIIAYLDPTPTSYPGFILSDDYGRIDTEECPCGRFGSTFVLDRRLPGIDERGCSLKMDRYAENSHAK